MGMPRVLLADDHRLLCEALTKLLEPYCTVLGSVSDGRALLAAARKLQPEIVVLDIAMPLLNGLDAARQLKQIQPQCKIIFLTMNEDPDLMAEAFQIGASGYLLKNAATTELVQAIQTVQQGRTYVTPPSSKELAGTFQLRHNNNGRKSEPSPRQREVLQLLAEGKTMKEVARIMKITPRTVAFHKYSLMEELQIKTNAELVQYAIKHHIISP
ncbi:MAG: response regulator transcription factor [Planctomycetia bacterium]|nr:response regulator transcription factor [Planctomycetia bacterium]